MVTESKFKKKRNNGIPDEWEINTIEESVEALIDYRGKTPKKVQFGIPLITAKIVKDGGIREPEEFISSDDYDAWMRRGMPKPGDVVITTEAPLGEVAQLDARKVALAQRLITLRGKTGYLDNTYLRFALQSPFVQTEIRRRESGTTVIGIKQSELRKALLPIPPFSEQRAIAKILSDLDIKIELNRRMNETLEAMARAMFKQWFMVVEDADKCRASDLIDFNPRITAKKGNILTYVDMDALPTDGMNISKVMARAFAGGSRFQNNDTLLARITPCLENGKTAFVNFLTEDSEIAFGSTEFIVMRPKKNVSPQFVYCLARESSFRECAIQSMVGSSGRQRVQAEVLQNFEMPQPDQDLMSRFDSITKSFFQQIKKNREESISLSNIRDTLLPKLMSGEIRVGG